MRRNLRIIVSGRGDFVFGALDIRGHVLLVQILDFEDINGNTAAIATTRPLRVLSRGVRSKHIISRAIRAIFSDTMRRSDSQRHGGNGHSPSYVHLHTDQFRYSHTMPRSCLFCAISPSR